jgi:hypothetical protein
MKAKNKSQSSSITGPLLESIVEEDKARSQALFLNPTIGSKPLPQPDSYQDPGGGYNANFVDPQD